MAVVSGFAGAGAGEPVAGAAVLTLAGEAAVGTEPVKAAGLVAPGAGPTQAAVTCTCAGIAIGVVLAGAGKVAVFSVVTGRADLITFFSFVTIWTNAVSRFGIAMGSVIASA